MSYDTIVFSHMQLLFEARLLVLIASINCPPKHAYTYSYTPAQIFECEALGHVKRPIGAQALLLGVIMLASKECN